MHNDLMLFIVSPAININGVIVANAHKSLAVIIEEIFGRLGEK